MPPARHRTNERSAIAALFVMFALLVQALIPTHVMAAGVGGGITICTAAGTETLAADGKTEAPVSQHGGPCQDCLAAAHVATAPPPTLAIQPVAYVIASIEHIETEDTIAPRARAPPRPPGQGPPASLQTA